METEPFKVGDEARWDGIGPRFTAEPQVVRIAIVHAGPAPSYSFHFTGQHPHPDGPVRARGFAHRVSPEHLTREG